MWVKVQSLKIHNFSFYRVQRAKEHSEAVTDRQWSELLDGHVDVGLGRNESQLWGGTEGGGTPRLAHTAQVALRPNLIIFILARIFAHSALRAAYCHSTFPEFQSGRSSPFLLRLPCFSPYSRPTARPFRAPGPGRRSTKRPYRWDPRQLPNTWLFTELCTLQEEEEEICT